MLAISNPTSRAAFAARVPIGACEVPRLLAGRGILPLVISRCRDEAAGSPVGIPKERLVRNRFSACVERGRLQIFEGLWPPRLKDVSRWSHAYGVEF